MGGERSDTGKSVVDTGNRPTVGGHALENGIAAGATAPGPTVDPDDYALGVSFGEVEVEGE